MHPHLGRWPAITTHRHGAGRITYGGTLPDPVLARALFDGFAPDDAWRPAHPSVTATSATARDGRRVRFLHHWSWEEAVRAGARGRAGRAVRHRVRRGGAARPWDVKVLQEEAP